LDNLMTTIATIARICGLEPRSARRLLRKYGISRDSVRSGSAREELIVGILKAYAPSFPANDMGDEHKAM
jgi:hypothetical protein